MTNEITQRYALEIAVLSEALDKWEDRLRLQAEAFDSGAMVGGRVKSLRSVIGKVYKDPSRPRDWSSLKDLVALKVVFPTQSGVEIFSNWLSSQSAWSPDLDEKIPAPHELKYQSKQFDLTDPEVQQSDGSSLRLEVQVRTAAVDAWYVVDHRLRYKGAVQLPSLLQRRILRLIVLTELFDEEVTAVIEEQAILPE